MRGKLAFFVDYFFDIFFASAAQVPWVALKYFAKPYKRGFFCDDQSLMYPYKNSTVSNAMLTAINLTIPILTIIIVELKLSGALQSFFTISESESSKCIFLRFAYKTLCIFFVGYGINQSTTNILKWSIGRLRPHYFSVCLPSFPTPCNHQVYIGNAECYGSDGARIKDARLSFPSGHASSSMYCMLFVALYLHLRTKRCRLQTFKAFSESCAIVVSLWIGATRVSDYKHHWSDVLAGFALGSIYAALFVSCAIYNVYPYLDRVTQSRRDEGYQEEIFRTTRAAGRPTNTPV